MSKTILIAGGTGLVGKEMTAYLKKAGHTVRILTRGKTDLAKGYYHWNPSKDEIDPACFDQTSVIINLAGAGIADKKWSAKRKQEIIDSRVIPALFLSRMAQEMKSLEHYISASGINCYGYASYDRLHEESDPFGADYLSQVVRLWEDAADTMQAHVKVAKIRISVVLTEKGGALPKIAGPIKNYIGAPLGSGKQWMPWITLHDLIRLFEHVMNNKLEGAYNAVAENPTNKEFTQQLAKQLNKPLWLPPVPGFVLKLFLGEMSSVVLQGLQASNQKIVASGFNFNHATLEEALASIYV